MAEQNAVSHGRLYPTGEPFATHRMPVGDGHVLYVEECGRPDGVPVVVLHGGPGGGCSPFMRRFFDPAHYRIVLFDQRGCGRSRPTASVEANTTQHLIRDIEEIRQKLGISIWLLFGGSWGATLALAYAQAHPDHVTGLICAACFWARRPSLTGSMAAASRGSFPINGHGSAIISRPRNRAT